jgi:hypothetical protein
LERIFAKVVAGDVAGPATATAVWRTALTLFPIPDKPPTTVATEALGADAFGVADFGASVGTVDVDRAAGPVTTAFAGEGVEGAGELGAAGGLEGATVATGAGGEGAVAETGAVTLGTDGTVAEVDGVELTAATCVTGAGGATETPSCGPLARASPTATSAPIVTPQLTSTFVPPAESRILRTHAAFHLIPNEGNCDLFAISALF